MFASRVIFIAAITFWVTLTFATVVRIDKLSMMTARSDVIVHARVISQNTKEDAQGRIITLTTLEIVDGLKGAKAGDIVTVYQVGGMYHGRTVRIEGAHRYHIGEEIVLFGSAFDHMIVSYGLGLGKFHIERDSHGTNVIEDLHDLIEAKPAHNGGLMFQEPQPRKYRSLEDFKRQIRLEITRQPLLLQHEQMQMKAGGMCTLPGEGR